MSASSKQPGVVTRWFASGLVLASLTAAASAQTPVPPSGPVPLVPPANQTPTAPLSEPMNAGSARAIAVGVLEELGAERVGLLDQSSGGLPNDMWDGTDPALVRAVLAQLPHRMPSLTMRKIAQNLLLPPARQPRAKAEALDLPAGDAAPEAVDDPAVVQPPWLLEARVAALAGMGDWASVNGLLELVAADRMTAPLVRARVDGLLIAGNTQAACSEGQAALSRQPETQWQKLLVYCQFATKQASAAQLGLSLLREQGVDDPVFFWAADLMQGQRPATPANVQRLAPLELVMLRAANRPFPDAVVRDGDPTMLRVLASMPALAPDEEKGTPAEKKERARLRQEERITMSERAVALGVLDPDMLRARYLDLDLSQDAKPVQLAEATADNVRARVLMYQLAKKQTVPTARAEVIARAIELARADRGQKSPDLVTVGRVYASFIAELSPSPDLLWFAGTAVRGLLAAGMTDKAATWLELVNQMARGSTEAGEMADSLWVIEHLLAANARGSFTPRNLRAWQATVPAANTVTSRQAALNLLAAMGDRISATEWLPVITAPPVPGPVTLASPAVWQGLTLAARDAKSGPATAFALVALGESGPHAGSHVTLNKVIENLVIVGREDDARALALEAALVQGL